MNGPPASSPRPARLPTDAGSVFVESIIAAAIVAMALGATLKVVADGASRERATEARRTALQVAQSELAAVGAEIPLRSGQQTGVTGEMIWRVDISPADDAVESSAVGPLWQVSVAVQPREGGAPLARLDTLRLGQAS